jgi:hypothetical protein
MPKHTATATRHLPTHLAKDPSMNDEQANHRRGVARLRRLSGGLATLAATAIAGALLSAAPALAGECPNEQLRIENNSTQLPECRAYELVTSPYKEGFTPVLKGVTDGAIGYNSIGNFAGGGLGATLNSYNATRSQAGWLTTSLNPSGPTYADGSAAAQGLSSDQRSALWQMRLATESTDNASYYLRAPDGTFTLIGPAVNPAVEPPGAPGPGGPTRFITTEAVSADLSHVLFSIEGAYVFPGISPALENNLYEYVGMGSDRPQYVAVDNAGNQVAPGQGSCAKGMSSDGRVVFFTTGCEGHNGQLWARINETTTIEASASECTRSSADPGGVCNGAAEAHYAGASSDGSRLFFTTTQQLVNGDTNQTNDLYACNIPPGTPTPVGLINACETLTYITGNAADANVQGVDVVAGDGSRVYFTATGLLAANTDALGEQAKAGDDNLYVWQKDASHPTGQTTFVAKQSPSDSCVWENAFGCPPPTAQSTADGRYLVFATASQLLPSDTDEVADVYRYDADTGSLLRLSTDSSGTGGNEPGFDVTLQSGATSADGSTVVFQTNEGLSPADSNGTRDVYEWHAGHVSLISSGRPSLEQSAERPVVLISPSGTDIYFNITAQLTPNDGDTDPDIYDARIAGGFSFPQPQPCSGEACQGALTPRAAMPGASASATFSGAGNLVPPVQIAAVPKPKPKPLTRAQKLARALKACKAKHNKKKQAACEKQARRTYRSSK